MIQFGEVAAVLTSAPLPGDEAHREMRAVPVGNVKFNVAHGQPPLEGGVLILLYEDDGRIRFPLIKRPMYQGVHSGQISLPGGKAEQNEKLSATALREGEEEIGIIRGDVQLLKVLTSFHVIPSNIVITPFVSMTEKLPLFAPNPQEVERILFGDLNDLLKPGAVKETEIRVGDGFRLMARYFEVEGEMVWGATAMILNELRMMILAGRSK